MWGSLFAGRLSRILLIFSLEVQKGGEDELKGPKGPKGPKGRKGPKGPKVKNFLDKEIVIWQVVSGLRGLVLFFIHVLLVP